MELIKYGFAGGISTIVNLFLFFLMEKAGLYYIFANIISYFIAVILNFFLNERFVFKKKNMIEGMEEGKRFAKFMMLRVANLLADNGLFYLCVSILNMPLYFSRIGLTFIEIVIMYGLMKIVVFQKNSM